MSVGIPECSGFQPNPLHRRWRRQKMTPSKRTACDGETERSGGAQVPSGGSRTSNGLGGDTDTIRPLPRERSIGRDTAGEAATRPDTSHKEGSGRSPDHRTSEISSVARRTLRSVWPDRGALPEVRGRADRVGSLADGQGDRTARWHRRVPDADDQRDRETFPGRLARVTPSQITQRFHRSRVVEHDDHVDLGAPRS